jgi:hypothetical protein
MAPKVELKLGDDWVDISDPSLPDVQAPVRITRGRGDEQSRVTYGRCSLSLKSKDAKYSLRNPKSATYGLIGRNTPIRVGIGAMSDDFDRSLTDNWGTSSSGHAWTIVQGTAANFDVAGGVGTIATTAGDQVAVLPNSYGEVDVLVKISFSSLTGNPDAGIVVCWQDADNHYRYVIDNSGGGQLRIERWADGGDVPFKVLANSAFSLSAGTDYWLRASFSGAVRAKVWEEGDDEPDWMAEAWLNDPSALNVPLLPRCGRVGLFAVGGSAGAASFSNLEVVSWRFHGEVSEWPPKPDQGVEDVVTIPIVAAGPLRRLARSRTAAASPMFRDATKPSTLQYAAAYWPMEDGEYSSQFASGLPGGPPMTITGPWNLASSDAFPGSRPLPVLGEGANWYGPIPSKAALTGNIFYRILLTFPESGLTNGVTLINIYVTGGNIARFGLVYGTGGNLTLQAIGYDGSLIGESVGVFALDGKAFHLAVELTQDGSSADVLIGVFYLNDNPTDYYDDLVDIETLSDTLPGVTIGRPYLQSGGGSGTMAGCAVGHLGVGSNQDFMLGPIDAMLGNLGEPAGYRMRRIADDYNIPLQIIGNPDETAPMGPQIDSTPLGVLQSCADADGGVLYESRNEFGLSYITKRALLNHDAPELDYQAGQVANFEPVDDDQAIVNEVTVARTFGTEGRGSFARAVLEEGPLSIREPPDGVGTGYGQDIQVNVAYDVQLPNIAWWKMHLGTWDDLRFRSIQVSLADTVWQANPDLAAQLLALDTGSCLTIVNPPPWLPSEPVRQMVQGYEETLGAGAPDEIDLDWTTTPSGPWQQVGVYDQPRARYESLRTYRHSSSGPITSTAAGITFRSVGMPWVTDSSKFPFDIVVGGEVMTVTAIDDAVEEANNEFRQLWTVIRSVNGVVKSHPVGVEVHLADRVRYA